MGRRTRWLRQGQPMAVKPGWSSYRTPIQRLGIFLSDRRVMVAVLVIGIVLSQFAPSLDLVLTLVCLGIAGGFFVAAWRMKE